MRFDSMHPTNFTRPISRPLAKWPEKIHVDTFEVCLPPPLLSFHRTIGLSLVCRSPVEQNPIAFLQTILISTFSYPQPSYK